MKVEHVEAIVEEPSMEAALRVLLPRLLGKITFGIYSHQGKADMLARLPERLRGYSSWLPDTWCIIVVVDRDEDNCRQLKIKLDKFAESANLITRSASQGQAYSVVNRLAIEELESWYFGDWEAVRAAYPRVSASIPAQTKYRDPDAIRGGAWEAFEDVLQRAGYFKGGLGKIEAARAIAPHWNPSRNTSRSFQVFCDAIIDLTHS